MSDTFSLLEYWFITFRSSEWAESMYPRLLVLVWGALGWLGFCFFAGVDVSFDKYCSVEVSDQSVVAKVKCESVKDGFGFPWPWYVVGS